MARASSGGDRAAAGRFAIVTFMARVAGAAIAYLSQVALARWMGSFEYGVFVSVWVWVTLIGAGANLGFGTSIMRFAAESLQVGDFERLRGVLFGTRLLVAVVATVLAGLGAAGVFLLEGWVNAHFLAPIYLALVCVPLFALTEVQDGIARTYGWAGLALGPSFIWRPLMILGLMLAAMFAGLEPVASTAMLAAIGATWATGLLQLAFIRRRIKVQLPPGPRHYEFRRWIAVSLPMFGSDTFRLMLFNIDVIVLGFLVPADQVAIYFASTKTLALVAFVNYAVASAATHRFAASHAAGDRDRLEQLVRDAATWSFWPSLAAAGLMLAFGGLLLSLFGERFVAGHALMPVLVAGLLVRSAVGPLDKLLNMLGHERLCAGIYAAALMSGLAALLLLVPAFGLMGAATAMAAATVAESVLLMRAVRRSVGVPVSILGVFRFRGASQPAAAT